MDLQKIAEAGYACFDFNLKLNCHYEDYILFC
jgi:hypothetical protein